MRKVWIIFFISVLFNLFQPIQASADVATSIIGELRFRPEYRDNADFNKAADDTQSFYGQRIRLGVNAKINPDLTGFVQLQDSRIWGTDDPVTDKSNEKVDIHQGYVVLSRIGGLSLDLKIGRQELIYGDARLVGASGWGNGRAFDAVKLMYSGDMADVDFWTAKVKEYNSCDGGVGCTASASSGQDTDFYGIYSTIKKNPIPDSNLQGYLLYKYDGPTDLSEYTVGARLAGKGVGIDYTGEFAYQFGKNGSGNVAGASSVATTSREVDIAAYAFVVEAGYMIPAVWSPRVAVEYDRASGSDSGEKDKTFDNLYPTNHALYGYMDYQGWMNMSDTVLKASARPSDKSYYYLAYHIFSLVEKKDAWYSADGKARTGFGASSPNTKDAVGQEIDLLTRYTFNQSLKVEGGISKFFAGDYIKNKVETAGGTSEDSTWAYLMGTVSF